MKSSSSSKKYELLKTSLTYQTQQFFDNSTLHGVRYIKEEGRPFCEKFMWFCFTSIGGVATLIIIVSLWEKFQTNPTITGLDTDFHNWDVSFPTVALCLNSPANDSEIDKHVDNNNKDLKTKEFLRQVTNFSYYNLEAFEHFMNDDLSAMTDGQSLKVLQTKFVTPCRNILDSCVFKAQYQNCCDVFKPLITEMGFCYAFNSRHAGGGRKKKPDDFKVQYIRETDEKWALSVVLNKDYVKSFKEPRSTSNYIKIYIQSHHELPILDVSPQHNWVYKIIKLAFSAKQTYTTDDARQLSIKQRRCVFEDEIKLDTDYIYTYSACMMQCRMKLSRKLCNCVPFFYEETDGYKLCEVEDLKCLVENRKKLQSKKSNCQCDLGCSNTVYEVEKLQDGPENNNGNIELSFVSWPMVRYKREVLFGWVDLLVSFGGIAGLFLGFSLLSGVEMIYYFTMRACCMVIRNEDELRSLQQQYAQANQPPLDLSLTPYFMKKGSGVTRVQPLVPSKESKDPFQGLQHAQRPELPALEFLP